MVSILPAATVLALLAVARLGTAVELRVQEVENHLPADPGVKGPADIVKQMVGRRCARQYSLQCLQLDLAKVVDRLSSSPGSFQLLPGVSLSSRNLTVPEEFPSDLAQELARDAGTNSLDDFLLKKVDRYLNSVTLSVKLAEAVEAAKGVSSYTQEGRKRKTGNSGLLMAGLFSGGTLMMLGMSALAAMAGKALMTALLSLVLSGMAAFRGGGGGGGPKSTTYEIITKPIVSHSHTHSSEVQHEAHGGHHAYGYARSMAFDPVLPAAVVNGNGNDTKDPFQLAYRMPQSLEKLQEKKE